MAVDENQVPTTLPVRWVRAAPFRAHLWSIVGLTGVHWRVIALRAGVSPSLVRHLLFGDHGRSVRRISPSNAARIGKLDIHDIARLDRRPVGATPTARRFERLCQRGVGAAELAAVYQVDGERFGQLATSPQCSELTELVVLAASLEEPAPTAGIVA